MTKMHPLFDESRYCRHCGLPQARCQELGGEVWHELWDETVDAGDTLGLLMEIGAPGSPDIGIVRRIREALIPAYDRASDLQDKGARLKVASIWTIAKATVVKSMMPASGQDWHQDTTIL
jgi:hypothetical protein